MLSTGEPNNNYISYNNNNYNAMFNLHNKYIWLSNLQSLSVPSRAAGSVFDKNAEWN